MDKLLTESSDSNKSLPKDNKKNFGGTILRFIREFVSLCFWLYVLCKLFIFDIDTFLLGNLVPNYLWILNYKFFFLIGILSVLLVVTKNKHILVWSLYILFYPLIIITWKIPYFILRQKSWILAFAFINSLTTFFKSVKYNFVITSSFLIAFCITISLTNKYFLWGSVIALLCILVITYFNRFILIFKPSTIYQIQSKIVSKLKYYTVKVFPMDTELKKVPTEQLNAKQLEKWTTNLQMSVLFNRSCYFIAKKLRDYQTSKFNIVTYVLNLLILIIITVFTFAVVNLGIFKIDHSMFNITVTPSFFNFFFYSFNNLLFNSINSVMPVQPISQSILMLEEFFALFLVAILVTLIFSVKNEKNVTELNDLISKIKAQAEEMESYIEVEYSMPINRAIEELDKVKAGLIKAIYWLSKYIE